jgi:hypothetical protein
MCNSGIRADRLSRLGRQAPDKMVVVPEVIILKKKPRPQDLTNAAAFERLWLETVKSEPALQEAANRHRIGIGSAHFFLYKMPTFTNNGQRRD